MNPFMVPVCQDYGAAELLVRRRRKVTGIVVASLDSQPRLKSEGRILLRTQCYRK
jgi:hypothetical protein